MTFKEKPGKKCKSALSRKDIRSALAAYKLVAYMNAAYSYDGRRSVYVSISTEHDAYLMGLDGWEPPFSSARVDKHDRSLFMTFDWIRNSVRHDLLTLLDDPARWRDIQPFARVYFYEAGLRTLDPSMQVYNLDLRIGEEVACLLMEKPAPVSYMLKKVRENIHRTLNVKPELYLVLETHGKNGLKAHLHGAVLIDRAISKEDLRKPLRLALGDFDRSRQIFSKKAYPKRAAYLSKQAFETAERMAKAGFKSDAFLAATRNVRAQARSIWEDEIRIKDDDVEVDDDGVVRHKKLASRLMDLGVHAIRANLKKKADE